MHIPGIKNPKLNSRINPRFNTVINPRYNTMINPRYNTMINPRYNTMINPRYNTMINPRYNTMINPRYNTMINPRYNTMINPRLNVTINPNISNSFDGLYIFDLDLEVVEFVVHVNPQFIQVFDFTLTNTMFGVAHNQKGYCLFNMNEEFIGHIESDSLSGYNMFDISNAWTRIIK